MARDRRARNIGRKGIGSFLQLPKDVLHSEAYRSLNGWQVKLLVDIASQFNGKNNGDLCAAFSVMEDRGWNSKTTLTRSLKALLDSGLIEMTRQGGRNQCSLFAVTWRPIDECSGKLEVKPTNGPSARYLNWSKAA